MHELLDYNWISCWNPTTINFRIKRKLKYSKIYLNKLLDIKISEVMAEVILNHKYELYCKIILKKLLLRAL